METALTILPSNHGLVISNMHPHAAALMKAKYEGDKITRMNDKDVVSSVRQTIQECFMSLGHWDSSRDKDVLEHQTKEMITHFYAKEKNLTIQEFKIILRNLVAGEYREKKEDILTCTVQSMIYAIQKFKSSETSKMAFSDYHTQLKLTVAPKVVLTLKEQEEIVRKGCINAYNDFLQDGSMPKYGAVYYKYLKPRLNITWSENESEEIRTIAKHASIGNETNYKTECKNVALKKWFQKIKPITNYDNFKNLLEPFK